MLRLSARFAIPSSHSGRMAGWIARSPRNWFKRIANQMSKWKNNNNNNSLSSSSSPSSLFSLYFPFFEGVKKEKNLETKKKKNTTVVRSFSAWYFFYQLFDSLSYISPTLLAVSPPNRSTYVCRYLPVLCVHTGLCSSASLDCRYTREIILRDECTCVIVVVVFSPQLAGGKRGKKIAKIECADALKSRSTKCRRRRTTKSGWDSIRMNRWTASWTKRSKVTRKICANLKVLVIRDRYTYYLYSSYCKINFGYVGIILSSIEVATKTLP